jgi:hypothetical protein
MKKLILTILIILTVASSVHAAVVILKNGKKLEGDIIARTTQFIKIDIGIGVDLTYYLEDIESIDGFKIVTDDGVFFNLDPEEEINAHAEAIAVDIPEEPEPQDAAPTPLDDSASETPAPAANGTSAEPTEPTDMTGSVDKMEEFKQFEKINALKKIFERLNVDTESSTFPMILAGIMGLLSLIGWIITCLPLVMIAKKLDVSHRWMGWIPLLQVFLFLRMAHVPFWWLILLFIPVVNFFIPLVLWFKIIEGLGKPTWIAFLMYLPLINFFTLWYLALTKPAPAESYAL